MAWDSPDLNNINGHNVSHVVVLHKLQLSVFTTEVNSIQCTFISVVFNMAQLFYTKPFVWRYKITHKLLPYRGCISVHDRHMLIFMVLQNNKYMFENHSIYNILLLFGATV